MFSEFHLVGDGGYANARRRPDGFIAKAKYASSVDGTQLWLAFLTNLDFLIYRQGSEIGGWLLASS